MDALEMMKKAAMEKSKDRKEQEQKTKVAFIDELNQS